MNVPMAECASLKLGDNYSWMNRKLSLFTKLEYCVLARLSAHGYQMGQLFAFASIPSSSILHPFLYIIPSSLNYTFHEWGKCDRIVANGVKLDLAYEF